jgi:hypothetical protein
MLWWLMRADDVSVAFTGSYISSLHVRIASSPRYHLALCLFASPWWGCWYPYALLELLVSDMAPNPPLI